MMTNFHYQLLCLITLPLILIHLLLQQQEKKNDRSSRLIDKNEIVESLKTIHDPELPVNIYDLGLIYDIRLIDKNDLKIKMSLTAPGCPVAGEMPGQVANTLAKIPNVGLIEVELVWEPAWTKDRMSEDAKLALDIY